ncbi:MAG TPA: phosphopyruvate hydratase [bacterium]|nr:phosphopyruvate hydratase [bacterium]
MKIREVKATEILDSRGNPTVSVQVTLESGVNAIAAVPSGASTGTHEALEMRDGDKKRYMGKGVLNAVENVNKKIAPAVKGKSAEAQKDLDELMIKLDGTENKSKLGANAILGVSLAACRAAALEKKLSLYEHIRSLFSSYYRLSTADYQLPVPMMNILNGGAHADNNVDLQEFMVAPYGFSSFRESLRAGAEIYQNLKKILKSQNLNTSVGDEGGFAPNLKTNEDALKVIKQAVEAAGYRLGENIAVCLDPASSGFFENGKYVLEGEEPKKTLTPQELSAMYASWVSKYSIFSIEDGHAEDDWDGWKHITKELGAKIQLVGDDIFVTNPGRLKQGIEQKAANSILIKLNQIGSLTETLQVIALAYKNGYTAVISHRSGETEDAFISDLAVAVNTGQLKTGAPCRSERVCKYNRLLYIENELGNAASLGKTLRSR